MSYISAHTTSNKRALLRVEMPHWPQEGWFGQFETRLREIAEDQEALLLMLEISCVGEGTPSPTSFIALNAIRYLEDFPRPVLGLVNGECYECCLEMAIACDLLFATVDSRFGLPSGRLPGLGGTQRLVRMVGLPRAKELYLAGRIWSAEEAFSAGLLNGVEGDFESLQASAAELADTLLTRSPKALSLCKEVIHAGYDMDLRNGCEFERQVFSLCFTTHDQKEGMTAFAEKREPRFEDLK